MPLLATGPQVVPTASPHHSPHPLNRYAQIPSAPAETAYAHDGDSYYVCPTNLPCTDDADRRLPPGRLRNDGRSPRSPSNGHRLLLSSNNRCVRVGGADSYSLPATHRHRRFVAAAIRVRTYNYGGLTSTFATTGSVPCSTATNATPHNRRNSGGSTLGYGYGAFAGRLWPSRDPIGEAGGANMYAVLGNDAENDVDMIGLNPVFWECAKTVIVAQVKRVFLNTLTDGSLCKIG